MIIITWKAMHISKCIPSKNCSTTLRLALSLSLSLSQKPSSQVVTAVLPIRITTLTMSSISAIFFPQFLPSLPLRPEVCKAEHLQSRRFSEHLAPKTSYKNPPSRNSSILLRGISTQSIHDATLQPPETREKGSFFVN